MLRYLNTCPLASTQCDIWATRSNAPELQPSYRLICSAHNKHKSSPKSPFRNFGSICHILDGPLMVMWPPDSAELVSKLSDRYPA